MPQFAFLKLPTELQLKVFEAAPNIATVLNLRSTSRHVNDIFKKYSVTIIAQQLSNLVEPIAAWYAHFARLQLDPSELSIKALDFKGSAEKLLSSAWSKYVAAERRSRPGKIVDYTGFRSLLASLISQLLSSALPLDDIAVGSARGPSLSRIRIYGGSTTTPTSDDFRASSYSGTGREVYNALKLSGFNLHHCVALTRGDFVFLLDTKHALVYYAHYEPRHRAYSWTIGDFLQHQYRHVQELGLCYIPNHACLSIEKHVVGCFLRSDKVDLHKIEALCIEHGWPNRLDEAGVRLLKDWLAGLSHRQRSNFLKRMSKRIHHKLVDYLDWRSLPAKYI